MYYRCGRCRELKPEEEFAPSQRKNGMWCRACCRLRYAEQRELRAIAKRYRTCKWCGASIAHRNASAKWCGSKCKEAAKYQRRKAAKG